MRTPASGAEPASQRDAEQARGLVNPAALGRSGIDCCERPWQVEVVVECRPGRLKCTVTSARRPPRGKSLLGLTEEAVGPVPGPSVVMHT